MPDEDVDGSEWFDGDDVYFGRLAEPYGRRMWALLLGNLGSCRQCGGSMWRQMMGHTAHGRPIWRSQGFEMCPRCDVNTGDVALWEEFG